MRIQLCLHHAYLSLIQVPLTLYEFIHVGFEALYHVVEVVRELPQFVAAVKVYAGIQAALFHLRHGGGYLAYGV